MVHGGKGREGVGKNVGELPFRIDRGSRTNLAEQMADGLREAIVTGFYRPGDFLPNLQVMARQLGVSMRIPREAVEMLKREGLLDPRPCIGCKVLSKSDVYWRGKVLFICTDEDEVSYYTGMVVGELRRRLADSGYLLSCVSGMLKSSGRPDYSLLGPTLAQRVDFAIVLGVFPGVFRMLSKAGIPFAVVGNSPMRELPNFIGRIPYDNEPAFHGLVADCLRAGVKTVEQVDFEMSKTVDATRLCREVGISLKRVIIPPKRGIGWLEGIVRSSSEYFHKRLSEDGPLPDLFFFAEDLVALGALPAFEASGIDIPGRVKIATCAQLGFGPVFPKPLAKVLTNPREHGAVLARYAIDYLEGRQPDAKAALSPSYVPGDTL